MKYEVLRTYQDKETGAVYINDSIVIYDNKERANELITKGFLKALEEEPVVEVKVEEVVKEEHKKPAKKATPKKTEKKVDK